MNNKINNLSFVYCGSSQWSANILQGLLNEGLKPIAVITKIDKPAGREKKINVGALTEFANKNNITTYQVKNKLEFFETVKQLQPDFGVVVDFGIIITQEALDVPAHGFINVHPSLLPKYRGTSPVQTAILNNDKETGVSIMKLDADIDHGPIYWQKSLEITETDTTGSLLENLLPMAVEGLIEVINSLESLIPVVQNHDQAVFTKKILTSDCELNLQEPADKLIQVIKASQPKPCAWINHNGKRLKIISAHLSPTKEEKQFCLECGDGKFLVVKELQPEGKNVMSGKDYLNGIRLRVDATA